MSRRIARFAEQLRRELSEMIRVQVRDPRVGEVTITGVDVSGDLGVAEIYVRTVGDLPTTLQGLEAAAPFLRTQLGRILHVRRVPELRFREDRSYAGAQRIEEILSEVIPEDEAQAPGPDDEGAEEASAPAPDAEEDA